MGRIEDLDGDRPVQNLVPTQENPGHATRPDLALEHEPLCKPRHAADYNGFTAPARTPMRRLLGSSEDLDLFVLQAVQLPLPAFVDQLPGPRN
jgi:hypothetical protein